MKLIIIIFCLLFKGIEFYILHLVPICIFIIEILINFNTGYYQDGDIITNRKSIVKNYTKHMFWIDIINAGTIIFVA